MAVPFAPGPIFATAMQAAANWARHLSNTLEACPGGQDIPQALQGRKFILF
jgi:hypothetical protein